MAARLEDQSIGQNEPPIPSWLPLLHGPHLLVGLGEGQPHALVSGAAVPRRASLAAEARAGVDAADAGEAGMGVALGEEGPRRVRGCRRWALSRVAPHDFGGLNLENSGAVLQHLGRGALWGRRHRPRGQTRLCLDGARGATWRREGSAWRGLFREPLSSVFKGGGRNCEGERPQQRGEVVVGACVPGDGSVVRAGAPRWWNGWNGRWGL